VSAPFLAKEVAKLACGLFYSWFLLCNNNLAINLQSFFSGYVSGVLPHVIFELRHLGR